MASENMKKGKTAYKEMSLKREDHSEEVVVFKRAHFHHDGFNTMQELRNKEKLFDVTLKVSIIMKSERKEK